MKKKYLVVVDLSNIQSFPKIVLYVVCSLIDSKFNFRLRRLDHVCATVVLDIPGADPGFQVRGGTLKKIAPSGGRGENFGGISCEKSRFYAKKSYFFQLRREARKFLGYFVWKITILCQKILFFPILGGRAPGARLPPGSALYTSYKTNTHNEIVF